MPITSILTVDQMYTADRTAGVPSLTLMENAGKAVAEVITSRFHPRPVLVLCGPGNNGGDGFVIARLLLEKGWDVRVMLSCGKEKLKGDAAMMAARWQGSTLPLTLSALEGTRLVIDALYGIGLSRPVTGIEADILGRLQHIPVIAVDIPSGIQGDTGKILGCAARATLTVTFCRKKPGHVLLPGREYAGEVVVAPIGIPEAVLDTLACNMWENDPASWLHTFPFPTPGQHKYARGHVVVRGGGAATTGAASMAAKAALRAGAGVVTIACGKEALPLYAAHAMSVMTSIISKGKDFTSLLEDKRKNVVLIGPGNGINRTTHQAVLAALKAKKSCVLDADALTSFQTHPAELFKAIQSPVVLTPHEGEFGRIFPDIPKDAGKVTRAREAASISQAVVILKGGDTVIAHPDGRAAVNTNAPPWLATAGSGDVLAGMVAGILANGIEPFPAACMAVWLHGEAANIAGVGLIAEELPDYLPIVLKRLSFA